MTADAACVCAEASVSWLALFSLCDRGYPITGTIVFIACALWSVLSRYYDEGNK